MEVVPCRRRLVELAEADLLEVPLLAEAEVVLGCSCLVLEPTDPLEVPSV